MEGAESPSPNSPSSFNFSQQHHFYLAVDRIQFKMETLVDLLNMVGRRSYLPTVVCCSTRDELDAVCSALSHLSHISIDCLYSDLAEAERALIFEKFHCTTKMWNQHVAIKSEADSETGEDEQKSHVIIVTDACLPLLALGESPISSRVLINYELPTKKETYMRRITTSLAPDGIVISMVVGGEVITLRRIEETSSLVIAEMPINIFEMV